MIDELQESQKFKDLITVFCRGDKDAIRLCEDYLQVAHAWDDLIDRDKDLSPADINRAFCKALSGITRNPIFQDSVQVFSALSLITSMTWQIANKLESGNSDELIGSFILRNSLMQLIYFVVLISGARDNDEQWGIDIGEQFFREIFKGFDRKYKFFLSEMRAKNESHNKGSLRHRDRQVNC